MAVYSGAAATGGSYPFLQYQKERQKEVRTLLAQKLVEGSTW